MAEILKPHYRYLCKRPCFHDDYLQAFNNPNVTLVDCPGGIEKFTGQGPVVGGRQYEIDLLVYGTGFEPEATPLARRVGHEIVGRGGVTLATKWAEGPSSLFGMLVLASARDLILLFVAFELMSIPLYYLAGFLKREPEAVEAALKFFLVGTVSSAVLIYGFSFLYGIAGTTDIRGVAKAMTTGHPMLLLGMLLTLGGLGFKIAAFPFHMWVPDTYEAASTPFVAWLSVAPKAAGFIVIFRLYLEGMGDRVLFWVPAATGLAAVTIIGGNLMAIPQQNIKRLLAYSGVAHIGYMLVGFAAVSANGVAMMLFYLVAYLFGNMGAFLVVEAVAQAEGSEGIAAYRGLAQRSPILALSMLLFLLSLGGIPFVAGFWAKLYVFWAAAEQGLYWLVLLGAVLTVVALFYYLLVAKRMYIDAPDRRDPIPVAPLLSFCIFVCVLGVVLAGIYPKPLVIAALRAASPLF